MGVSPELQNQFEDLDFLPTNPPTFWENENKEVHNQETDLDSATRKIIAKKINVFDSKPRDMAPKKLCVCAPTNHAGSFKCRFHRITAAQKPLMASEAKTIGSRSHEGLKFEGQTQLSRFGRAAAAAAVKGCKKRSQY